MEFHCPNCKKKLEAPEKQCPFCCCSFEEKNETGQLLSNDKIDNIQDKNESIEWSKLKDMSIGSVMSMFSDRQSDEELSEENVLNSSRKSELVSDVEKNNLQEAGTKDTKPVEPTNTLNEYISQHKQEPPLSGTKSLLNNASTVDENLGPKTSQESVLANEELTDSFLVTEPDRHSNGKIAAQNGNTKKTANKKAENLEKTPNLEASVKTPYNTFSKKTKTSIEMDEAPIFFEEEEETPLKKENTEVFPKNSPTPSSLTRSEKNRPLEKETNTKKNKSYKQKALVLAVAIVLVGGGTWLYSQSANKKSIGLQAATTQTSAEKKVLKKELENYFTDEKQIYLKQDSEKNLDVIKEQLEALAKNDEKLNDLYTKIVEKQTAVKKVNALFLTDIVAEDKLVDAALKEDKNVTLALYEEKDAFDELMNQAIEDAREQYAQLQTAKECIDVFYEGGTFTDALTDESYSLAEKEVGKIKNTEFRTGLTNILTDAAYLLTEEQNTTAAEGVQNEQSYGNNSNDTGFSPPDSDGVYTSPVYTANPSDIADSDNSAWKWSTGVKEQVLTTCTERGYITEGNYTLQRARIVNGEGYYNLYGGNNQYLVTINAKTGWFKGNASRNAGR